MTTSSSLLERSILSFTIILLLLWRCFPVESFFLSTNFGMSSFGIMSRSLISSHRFSIPRKGNNVVSNDVWGKVNPPSAKRSRDLRFDSKLFLATHASTHANPANESPKRIRVITCDVTGTLVSFLGRLEDHYGNAARACGVEIPPSNESSIAKSFNRAYRETSAAYPCFGNSKISSKEWWRRCVRRSFDLVGAEMSEPEHERVFQRVYSTFGSHAAYGAFPDAMPFLKWAHRRGIACGVISNADERYGDSILPMLGLGDDMKFLCFSKNVGFEKPSKEIFDAAVREAEPWLCLDNSDTLEATTPLKPEEILHIGNDFKKDYIGAKEAGFHAVLLDRYDEKDLADSWRAGGALVFKDLIDVVEYLGREQFLLGSKEECSLSFMIGSE